jgi:hypothetical protein
MNGPVEHDYVSDPHKTRGAGTAADVRRRARPLGRLLLTTKGLSENKVFISGDMGEDDVVPLAVELIPLEVD